MFRNRRTSQKPDAALICDFQSKFPDVVSTPVAATPDQSIGFNDAGPHDSSQFPPPPATIHQYPVSFVSMPPAPYVPITPRASQMRPVFHSPAGDLHTPVAEMNWEPTPLIPEQGIRAHSEPPAEPVPKGPDPETLGRQYINQLFHNLNPFGQQFAHPTPQIPDQYGSDAASISMSSGMGSLYEDIISRPAYNPPSPETNWSDRPENPQPLASPFRFLVVLHTPTAITRPSDKTPITYLNKSQSYMISITDQAPPALPPQNSQYRTTIRIAFDDPAQRSDAAACWSLWRERRGAAEAKRHGGEPRAIEFLNGNTATGSEGDQYRASQLESASLDELSVVWSGGWGGHAKCAIVVRFNFLSTDFSFSKGVAGVAVRLYAQTEMITPPQSIAGLSSAAEQCYCKVKVFRDHGAERRVSNDTASVKKAIQKVEKQISTAGFGSRSTLKRRASRQNSISQDVLDHLLKTTSKLVPKDQINSTGAPFLQHTLQRTLSELENLFASPRPVSVFTLGLEEQDDSDPSAHRRTIPTKEATGANGKVACFYIRSRRNQGQDTYYRAVYLTQRTAFDFATQLAKSWNVPCHRIVRLLHVDFQGLRILVDDDVVRQLPEGQDMVAEWVEVPIQGRGHGADSTGFEVNLFY